MIQSRVKRWIRVSLKVLVVLVVRALSFPGYGVKRALNPGGLDAVPPNKHKHILPAGYRVVKRSVLGGLHHEYGLVKEEAS